jgi:hypothetical protein
MMVRVLVSLALLGCLLFPGSVPSLSELAPAEIMELSSVDSCGQVLEVPKIALLFLIKGPLYHGEMWEKWFESAQDMVPKEKVQEVLSCEEGGRNLLAEQQQGRGVRFYSANATTASTAAGAPRDDASKRSIYNSYDVVDACGSAGAVRQSCVQRQHLYSLYIHLRSDLDVSVLDGMWHPYLGNVSRVLTRWGTHSLVEATRNLLWNAYRDPLNQRFVLLSESHIPIWDPFTLYRVTMNQERSYVNAWWHEDMNQNRWTKKMIPAGLERRFWRKSSQWFALIRKHVKVVLDDKKIFRTFHEHCVYEWDFDNMKHRKCFSDEHYVPTLLSLHGLEDETIPFYSTHTRVDWSKGGSHPKSYEAQGITKNLVTKVLRSNRDCPLSFEEQQRIQRDAFKTFQRIGSSESLKEAICSSSKEADSEAAASVVLLPGCTMMARKFEENTTSSVLNLFTDCQNELDVITCGSK